MRNIYTTTLGWVERYYSNIVDPSASDFPVYIIETICSLAELPSNSEANNRMANLAAAILDDMDVADKVAFMNKAPLSGNIHNALMNPTWPEPKTFSDEGLTLSGEEESSYRQRMERIVVRIAEDQANRVMPQGQRKTLTYMFKIKEMQEYNDDPDGVYPYLQAEVGINGATMQEVAETVEAQLVGWTQANVAIEAIVQQSIASIRADDLETIPETVDNAKANITAIVNQLVFADE